MSRRTLLLVFMIAVSAIVASAKTDNWLEVRSPHFTVLCNSNERQARHVADQLEQMRSVFHKAFPGADFDPSSPILVIAVRDKDDFRTLEPEAYLAKGQANIAGLFLRGPDKNYILLRLDVENGEQPYASVYHEYTHFMLRHFDEWLPLWLNEGFAQFYETTELRDKEVITGRASTDKLNFLRSKQLLPLATLFAVDAKSPHYHEEGKVSVFYAESWVLTHYLQVKDRQNNTHSLFDYVNLVSNKVDPVTAARKAFGDLNVLGKSLDQYIANGYFTYIKLPRTTEADGQSIKVQIVTASYANVVRADLLARIQRKNDARTLLDSVLKDDPDNVFARETLGLLAFQEGKSDEAEKWYGQAVKLNSLDFMTHYRYASILMAQGFPGGHDAEIEASLRAATKLNPSFAPAFDGLATLFASQRTNLEEAHRFSVMAVQLRPESVNYRLHAANLLVQMQLPKDAIDVLQAALKFARNPEQVSSIRSQIDSIEKGQAARHEP